MPETIHKLPVKNATMQPRPFYSKHYDRPFIKKFKTASSCYIYDVNTNHLLKVDRVLYAIVDDIYRLSKTEIIQKWSTQFLDAELENSLKELKYSIKRDRLFRRERPKELRPFGGRSIREKLKEPNGEHLILNTTENCNLRCKYCLYSGRYTKQRVHSSKRMTKEVARRALDFFIEKSSAIEEPHIGFYGGEPLLYLDLIKYCVSYAESKRPNTFQYGMTTNGTLLTPELTEYLTAHNFNLLVSLDGPREVHDSYRVDKHNRGTWDRVLKNLKLLHEKSKDYFESHVSISAVIATNRNMARIQEFFEKHSLFSNRNVITSNLVYTRNALEFDDTDEKHNPQVCGQRSVYNRCEETLLKKRKLTHFLEGMFQREFMKIYNREICNGFDGGIHINGCCFPGQRRLFVNCRGDFYVCERLDNAFSLGSVDEGLVPKKVERLIDAYIKVSSSCLDCWAIRFCTKCYAGACVDGKINKDFREAECEAFRHDFEKILTLYQEVAENDFKAFDFLKKVTIS